MDDVRPFNDPVTVSGGMVFARPVRVEGTYQAEKSVTLVFRRRKRAPAFPPCRQHADDSDSSNRVTGSPRNACRSFPIRLNGRRLVLPGLYARARI